MRIRDWMRIRDCKRENMHKPKKVLEETRDRCLAKPNLEALDDMIDEEEGELEEDDEEEEEEEEEEGQGQEDQEEQEEGQEERYNADLYRKLIEDEFSGSGVD